jgi:uncharacterized protein (TIGR03435 family)
MFQSLLEERFHLKVHWRPQSVSGYALVVAKSGPRLTAAAESRESFSAMRTGPMIWKAVTLPRFASRLSHLLGRPVVDMTALDGAFDITLNASSDPADVGVSIVSAVRELGLALDSKKIDRNELVIDSVERNPTEN